MPPAVVIRPLANPRIQGWPRPVNDPSSESASAKAHGDPRAHRGGQAHQKCVPGILGGERSGEYRGAMASATISRSVRSLKFLAM